MAKKIKSRPEFIKQIDWPVIIFLLFLLAFLGGLTYQHYFSRQQQLRWQEIQALQTAEMAKLNNLAIDDALLEKADLNQDDQIDQTDVEIMQSSFLKIDSDSLKADLNQDGRVDTKDYALLAHIISSQKIDNDQE